MELADRGLNPQAEALEEAQTLIRLAVRDGWLSGKPKAVINEEVQKIIRTALKEITIPDLRAAAYRSLNAFAERQYNTYIRAFGFNPTLLLAVLTLSDASEKTMSVQRAQGTVRQFADIAYETRASCAASRVFRKLLARACNTYVQ